MRAKFYPCWQTKLENHKAGDVKEQNTRVGSWFLLFHAYSFNKTYQMQTTYLRWQVLPIYEDLYVEIAFTAPKAPGNQSFNHGVTLQNSHFILHWLKHKRYFGQYHIGAKVLTDLLVLQIRSKLPKEHWSSTWRIHSPFKLTSVLNINNCVHFGFCLSTYAPLFLYGSSIASTSFTTNETLFFFS